MKDRLPCNTRLMGASGAVMTVAGKNFPLSLDTLIELLSETSVIHYHLDKIPLWRAFTRHPAVSVRLAAVSSLQLPCDVLTECLNDSAYAVRLAARKTLDDVTTRTKVNREDERTRALFHVPCGELTYAGVTGPMYACDLESVVVYLREDDPLMKTGDLAEAIMASKAWNSGDLRSFVLTKCRMKKSRVRALWKAGPDDVRAALLCNAHASDSLSVSLGEVADLARRSREVFGVVFLTEVATEEAKRIVARRIAGNLGFKPDEEEQAALDALLTDGSPEEPVANAWDATDDAAADLENKVDASLQEPLDGRKVTLNWLGFKSSFDVTHIDSLVEMFPADPAGRRGSFLQKVAASDAGVASYVAAQHALGLRSEVLKPLRWPEGPDEATAWVEYLGERFYFDPAWLPITVVHQYLWTQSMDEVLLKRFAKEPALARFPEVRRRLAPDAWMTQDVALKLKDDTDDQVIAALGENPVFWEWLTVRQVRRFVRNDAARQFDFMMTVENKRRLRAVCPAFLDSDDPEIRELAGQCLARLERPIMRARVVL